METDSNSALGSSSKRPQKAYIPTLKPKIVEIVLNINNELISLCREYQNMGLVDDPEYMIYQKKLQFNIKYLSTVADYYLNPITNEPDLTINTSYEKSSNLVKLLHQAKQEHETYVAAWKELHLSRSKAAQEALLIHDKQSLARIKQTVPCNKIVQTLANDRDMVDLNYLKTNDKNMYIPTVPFKVPPGIDLDI
ncbi:hypothetical protein AYI70_g5563 [Smittium culicis]|uniref:SS18 N-terminal domain-containing protein n=1 Tax=Smittium culicis TaxID=133412 RepID=A0A1R1XTZ6_9FUNG|nr:hypothetical protein AYI70_g5563 [Smittium culicis]